MAEPDEGERRDENQEAIAAAAGALLGGIVTGPVGAALGAGLGPKLLRLVRGVWAELSESARQRQTDVLFWAIRAGVSVDEMEARIHESKRTELLTGVALNAAWQTAWEDKVRTLGRSLAAGLLADDNAAIETEQMIIAAIADIEGPHLALLELLACWTHGPSGLHRIYSDPSSMPKGGSWHDAGRVWPARQMALARPRLEPILPNLLGVLQRHGLITQNAEATSYGPMGSMQGRPEPVWSPTEFGELILQRFYDAGASVPDTWVTPEGT